MLEKNQIPSFGSSEQQTTSKLDQAMKKENDQKTNGTTRKDKRVRGKRTGITHNFLYRLL